MTPTSSVLHVINRNQHRGAENVAGNLHSAMLAAGLSSTIVALEDSPDDRRDDVAAVLRSPREVPHLLGWWRLRRVVRQVRPDAVLAHGFLSALAAAAATLGAGSRRPRLVWQRILRLPRPPRHPTYLLHRLVARRFDAAVCITPYLCQETTALGLRGDVELVPNHRPRPPTQTAPPPDGFEAPYVLFAGRLVDQKRPDRFVRVAEVVAAADESCRFAVAGMGPLRDEVERQVAASDVLTGRFALLGHVDPAPLLRHAACLLLTSDNESSPGIVVEALLQGCPVVTVAVDGVRELLGDGPGTIVEQGSEQALAAAVLAELRDPTSTAERVLMQASAQRFTTERVLPTYLRLLRVDDDSAQERDAPELVLVIPNLGVGGLERGTMSLARAAQAEGLPVSVITLTDPRVATSEFLVELESAGVPVRSLGLAGLGTYRRPVRLARAVRRLRRELSPRSKGTVVASAILDADLPARLAAHSLGLRHVAHLVSTTYADAARPLGLQRRATFGLARLLERRSSPLTDRYIALTQVVADYATAVLGIPSDKISVVGRGVDGARFAPAHPEGGLGQPVTVVSLGRLVHQKDHRCTIEAAALLDPAHFVVGIFGEGPEDGALRSLVRSLALPHDTLRGVTSSPESILGSADVFVSMARWEGQSNAVIEAMASGCLLVLSDIPVMREVAGPAADYVEPGDPAALAAAIAALRSLPPADVDERRRLGRGRALERFGEAALAQEAISVFLGQGSACQRHASGPSSTTTS